MTDIFLIAAGVATLALLLREVWSENARLNLFVACALTGGVVLVIVGALGVAVAR